MWMSVNISECARPWGATAHASCRMDKSLTTRKLFSRSREPRERKFGIVGASHRTEQPTWQWTTTLPPMIEHTCALVYTLGMTNILHTSDRAVAPRHERTGVNAHVGVRRIAWRLSYRISATDTARAPMPSPGFRTSRFSQSLRTPTLGCTMGRRTAS